MKTPIKGRARVSQKFGNVLILNGKNIYMEMEMIGHNGIDYVPEEDDTVYAPHDGVIVKADFDEAGYGNYVRLENKREGSVLAHMSSLVVSTGFTVKCGDKIGVTGSTGLSTGKHLHHGYYRIPRDMANGFKGYIDPLPFYTGSVTEAVPVRAKYSVGYELKPLVDVAVGGEPGRASFNYGKVSVTAPAKIIEIKVFEGITYYNIDQTYIGGGTGWVATSTIDDIEMWTDKKEPEDREEKIMTSLEGVESTINESEPSIPLEEQLRQVTEERDRLLNENSNLGDKVVALEGVVGSFKAIGFETPEQVNSFIKQKDAENLGIKTELTQVLQRNAALAKMVEEKDAEDATAIDEGIKASVELIKLKDDLVMIAKTTGTKPSPTDILQHIKNIKNSTSKTIELLKEEYNKVMVLQKKETTPVEKPINNLDRGGLEWLMSFLGLKEK